MRQLVYFILTEGPDALSCAVEVERSFFPRLGVGRMIPKDRMFYSFGPPRITLCEDLVIRLEMADLI